MKVKVKLLSHDQLFATPWTVAHQAPLSVGILQARILEWVAMPFSGGSSQPREGGRWILYHCATWEDPLFRVRIVISLGELELICYFFFQVILLSI